MSVSIWECAHPFLHITAMDGFYHLLTEILLRNKQIQSFCLVTVISNPVKWFLSQPKIHSMKNIQSLCLSFNCPEQVAELEERGIPYTKEFFSNLPLLENLRHLDVSCNYEGGNSGGIYCYSDRMVALFTQSVKKMTQLKSIDISGTNLASIISHSNSSDTECTGHCMPGFEGRQFDFLGLYGNEECRHSFIPARR
ncbi:uncharacterized protein LOC132729630, partial [Ruditapes philippinarum]|uniref:uncharacterized protein LOC132729630 n=1 Tax=Ruditapes philippinarum TaxID=129788 RepID=UPI00295B7E5F